MSKRLLALLLAVVLLLTAGCGEKNPHPQPGRAGNKGSTGGEADRCAGGR